MLSVSGFRIIALLCLLPNVIQELLFTLAIVGLFSLTLSSSGSYIFGHTAVGLWTIFTGTAQSTSGVLPLTLGLLWVHVGVVVHALAHVLL